MKIIQFLLLALLVSCNGVDLSLQAINTVNLKRNRVIKKDMTVYPGSYSARLEFSPRFVNLTIDGVRGTAYFKIPGGVKSLPMNGSRTLYPSQTGQPVVVTFDSTYDEYPRAEVRETESCTYIDRVPCFGPRRFGHDRSECFGGFRTVTRFGSRRVEYTPIDTVRNISVSAEGLEASGVDNGQRKEYTFIGECR